MEASPLKRYFGCHVSISGGLVRALETAKTAGVNSIQIHPSPPQKWNASPFKKGIEEEFLKSLPASGVERIFFHAIYLINLAHPEERMIKLSSLSLKHDLEFNHLLKGHGVVVHVGSLKHENNEAKGLERAANTINKIFDDATGDAPLLLEVAAGSGFTIGQKIEELARIFEMVDNKERLGFALDTQHLWASGYELPQAIDQICSVIDENKIKIVHLNDSKTANGSRVDRHENLGDGLIGYEKLQLVVRHPKLLNIPFVLETPGLKEPETLLKEVAKLKEMI